MSEENVEEIVRRGYARFNGAEREPPDEKELASLDVWHPDGVYVNDARDPDAGIHRGINAVRQQVGRWVEAYPDLQVEPLEIEPMAIERSFGSGSRATVQPVGFPLTWRWLTSSPSTRAARPSALRSTRSAPTASKPPGCGSSLLVIDHKDAPLRRTLRLGPDSSAG
jgi:hypothetical protein